MNMLRPTILFVDDEPHLLESIKTMLRKEPYRILTATSGEEALALFAKSEQDIDVIVSDERMPAMQGSVLLTTVRARFPDVVRVLLTGQASIAAAVRAVNDAHVHMFLEKPIAPDALKRALSDAIGARRSVEVPLEDDEKEARASLEAIHPGITRVQRDSRGAIVLDLEE